MRWPLGVLSRSRRDWAIEQMQWGTQTAESKGTGDCEVALNNTDSLARTLAVYAIVPWTAKAPQLVTVFEVERIDSSGTNPTYPVHTGNPIIAGMVTSHVRVDAATPSIAPTFKADGRMIAHPDGAPLWLIDPGWQLMVSTYIPFATNLISGSLICAFLWGFW